MTNAKITTELVDLDVCAISDAMDSLGIEGVVAGIGRLTTRKRICGSVRTVLLGAEKPAGAAVRHLATGAIESASLGEIIVVSQRTGLNAAGWGGVLSNAARVRGLAGVIVDGPARDIDEAEALDFPVFARAATARTARGRIHEIGYNCVLALEGGVIVSPGDYAIADASGAAFIPAARIEEVIRIARRIVAKERLMTEAVRRGEPVSRVMGADYEHMLEKEGR